MSAGALEGWIQATSSGIYHVAGVGFPRRDCQPGIQLLCGWVLTAGAKAQTGRKDERVGQKCKRCSQWLAKIGVEAPALDATSKRG